MLPVFVISIILVTIHLYGGSLNFLVSKHKDRIVSFGSGIAISYLFLWLLPELYKGEAEFKRFLFAFVLLGFSIFHVAEKYFYQHDKSLEELKHDLRELHSLAFFIYYVLVGLLLVDLFELGVRNLILFSIPIVFQSAVTSTSMERIHEKIKEKFWLKAYLSSAPIIGMLVGRYVAFSQQFFNVSLGFVVGMLFYTFIRDHMPQGKRGDVLYFVFGVVIYAGLIFLIEWRT